MPEPVRVRDNDTGHEYSTYAVNEEGQSYEGLTVLKDEPAVDATGTLLPPKYPEAESAEVAEPAQEADVVVDVPATTDTAATTEPEPTAPPAAKPTTKAPRPTDPKTTPKES